uniref:Coatomer subunit gamma n=1 Tax=Timema tahoe TaxID=61484 RepID=A0A7R9NWM9_9NEOP|nr:unnamed protein product [Timema tahoe]
MTFDILQTLKRELEENLGSYGLESQGNLFPKRSIASSFSTAEELLKHFLDDWACGGQWNRMVQFLAVLVQTVQSVNMELAVFFNGCLEQQRMYEWIIAQQRNRQKINQVLKHITNKGTPPPKIWWTSPVCLRTCLRMALRHLGVSVLCTMDDHHQEVIGYCREYGFHGLVADDGEYAVFDPPRYFSSEQLKLTYKGSLETKEYNLTQVAKGLNLSPDRFFVLAALLGNYLLTEQDLNDFYRKLGVTQGHARYIKRKLENDELTKLLISISSDELGSEYEYSQSLAHLCEFIEDCEHTSLAVRILHLLGKEGPRTKQPSSSSLKYNASPTTFNHFNQMSHFRYIRFIYNRVILENAAVRAAAVAAMAQFGAMCPDLLPNIQVLLARCQMDTDDEVRDRATYYYSILDTNDKSLSNHYIVEGLQVSIPGLERALHQYTLSPAETPFDMKSVPLATVPSLTEETSAALKSGNKSVTVSREESYGEKLRAVAELASLGPLFRSSEPVELTESETEYVVRCVKHSFTEHLVLQFDCLNTLNDQLLENVRVVLEPAEGYQMVQEIPCSKLPYNETGTTYIVLKYPEELGATVATFSAMLNFVVKDCDPTTGLPDSDDGYDDEYILEDVEVTLGDQIQKVSKANFGAAWEEAANYHELEDTYALSSMGSLEEAVKSIISFLGMQPVERSDKVMEGKSSHTLYLAGLFRGGHDVLLRAKLALGDGVTMQLTVRSTNPDIAELVTSAVG